MNTFRINVPLQPPVSEQQKKVYFYRAIAAIIFVLAAIWVITDFGVASVVFFLLLSFVSIKLYQSAEGNDFLRIMVGSYLLINDDRFVLERSHYAFQPGSDQDGITILWPAVRELRIGELSFDVLFQSGMTQTVDLAFLPPADLERVKERLWEVKVKYAV